MIDDLRVPAGRVDLSAIPTDETPGFTGDKEAGAAELAEMGEELADLQELLRQTLLEMNPQWPEADFDVEEQRRRLEQEDPLS